MKTGTGNRWVGSGEKGELTMGSVCPVNELGLYLAENKE